MELSLEKLSKNQLIQMLENERLKMAGLSEVVEKKDAELSKKDAELSKKNNQIVANEFEILRLKATVNKLLLMKFGSSSERFIGNNTQLIIPFGEYASEEQKKDETPVKETISYQREKRKSEHKGRNTIPDTIPVVNYVIEPDIDTTGMVKIGEERTEILEVSTSKIFKLVITRPKYANSTDAVDPQTGTSLPAIIIAPMPSRPIERCLAGNRLLALILVQKFIDHLPLYRQQQIFKRNDIDIAPSTIDSWVAQLGRLLEPLYDKLLQAIKAQGYVQMDETTIKVLDKMKKGTTHNGYLWAVHAPVAKMAAFKYRPGRSAEDADFFLSEYKGILQTDGYGVYDSYYQNDSNLHLACWAHVRRKFVESLSYCKDDASYVLTEIQKLYAIEDDIRKLTPQERKESRLKLSLPIINNLGQWISQKRDKYLPKSPMGEAITYTSNLWPSLLNYINDGNFLIDNNLIENKIRPIAIGRKNYLFAGSHNGAARSAMFYSFFACCSLNNIHPQKWLEYVLEVIADYRANKLHELLPHNIKPELVYNHKPFYELEIV